MQRVFGDEAVLRRAVGAETLSRGQRYAEDGAVIGAHWDDEGERVVGQVRGNGPRPYTAIAIIDSTPDGMLRSFRGACTCPVGTNCKHAVALALVRPGRAATSTWEQRLRSLGRPPEPAERTDKATVGLQFELVAPRAHDLSAHLNLRPGARRTQRQLAAHRHLLVRAAPAPVRHLPKARAMPNATSTC